METQTIVTNLVGALIFAIPLTARAYYKRSSAEANRTNAIAKSYAALEDRCVAAEAKAAVLQEENRMLEMQTAANELISKLSEQKTIDDGVIRGLRARLEEQERILRTIEGRR